MMRGLSLTQPWGWMMTEPGPRGVPVKPIENRRWHLPRLMRGVEFAICASKGMTAEQYLSARAFAAALGVDVPPMADLSRGVVLATARAVDCLCPGAIFGPRTWEELGLDMRWWMDGQHGFVVRAVRKLATPIPVKGALGFFELPADVEAETRRQLSAPTHPAASGEEPAT